MKPKIFLLLGFSFLLVGLVCAGVMIAQAQGLQQSTGATPQPSTIHPQFAFLDEGGENVLDTNQPVSTMKTCGQCHDST